MRVAAVCLAQSGLCLSVPPRLVAPRSSTLGAQYKGMVRTGKSRLHCLCRLDMGSMTHVILQVIYPRPRDWDHHVCIPALSCAKAPDNFGCGVSASALKHGFCVRLTSSRLRLGQVGLHRASQPQLSALLHAAGLTRPSISPPTQSTSMRRAIQHSH